MDSATFTEQEKKKKTERQIICPVANETNKLRVAEANPGNLLQFKDEMPMKGKEKHVK